MNSPLFHAIKTEDIEQVKILLAGNADVNERDKHNRTPLNIALVLQNHQIIKLLLDAGADVNPKYDDGVNTSPSSPLYWSSSTGDTESVRMLLKYGADVNAMDHMGITPLGAAAMKGLSDIGEILIEARADVNKGDRMPPLFHAIAQGHKDMVQLLLKHGAKTKMDNQLSAYMLSREQPDIDFMLHESDNMDIHDYVRGGDIDKVIKCLDQGAKIDALDMHNYTPLNHAIETGNLEITKLLLNRGANIEGVKDSRSTPLITAISWNKQEIVQFLIDYNANVNTPDAKGFTPIFTALIGNRTETGIDPDEAGQDGRTALIMAVKNGHASVAELLIEHGANIHAREDAQLDFSHRV